MKSVKNKNLSVLILGGRGFVGSAICSKLKDYPKTYVFTFDRHPGGKKHFQGDILSLSDLNKAIDGVDVVVNLVGLTPIRKPRHTTYKKVHVEGVKNVISVCKALKVKRLIHMSILGADKKSSIEFFRTRGAGEELVLQSGIKTTVFCPSIIYDKENELIKMLSKKAFTRMFLNIRAKIQPVYRQDIAKLYALAIQGIIKEKRIEIGGPDIMTIFQMAKKIYRKKGYSCISIPLFLVKPFMKIFIWTKLFRITNDQIKGFYINNITKSKVAEKYIQLTKFDKWLNRISL